MDIGYPHRDVVRQLDYQRRLPTPGETAAREIMEAQERLQALVHDTPEELAEVDRLNRKEAQAIIQYHDHGQEVNVARMRREVAVSRRDITRAATRQAGLQSVESPRG